MPVTTAVGGLSVAARKELEALRDKARKMGSKTKFSGSEAAARLEVVWKFGDVYEKILGEIR